MQNREKKPCSTPFHCCLFNAFNKLPQKQEPWSRDQSNGTQNLADRSLALSSSELWRGSRREHCPLQVLIPYIRTGIFETYNTIKLQFKAFYSSLSGLRGRPAPRYLQHLLSITDPSNELRKEGDRWSRQHRVLFCYTAWLLPLRLQFDISQRVHMLVIWNRIPHSTCVLLEKQYS